MDLSIVIPSYQGQSRLPGLMEALAAQQTSYQWEAIVVLDGSYDRSEAILRTWEDRLPLQVLARPDNRGRSHTLNQGFEAARGQVMVRCDDDLLPGNNYVQRFGDLLLQSPELGVVGLCRNTYPQNTYARIYGRPVDQRFRSEAYAVPPDKRWMYWAGNCGVHREAWQRVGTYDETFREYGWEDIDWGYRLARNGYSITLDSELETIHRAAATTVEIRVLRAQLSGEASGRFYRKHGLSAPEPPTGAWGMAVNAVSRVIGPRSTRLLEATLGYLPATQSKALVDLAVEAGFQKGARKDSPMAVGAQVDK